MATQNIEYFNCAKLPCAGCSQVDVILCVTKELVLHPLCPLGMTSPNDDRQTVDKGFIYARLISFNKWFDQCGNKAYRYIFSYDDAQLEPDAVLTASDILGVVCDGCLTEWVRDYAGQDITVQELTPGEWTITNQHGCQFVIDAASCEEVVACETVFVANDSTSIDFTTTPVNGHTLTGEVIIDPVDGNLLEVGANGLSVNTADICAIVPDCETPFEPTFGNGLLITNLVPDNGHSPDFDLVLDPSVQNVTTIGAAGILTDIITDGTITGAGTTLSPLTVPCSTVVACETDFTGVAGAGITITPGGVNGHAPTIATSAVLTVKAAANCADTGVGADRTVTAAVVVANELILTTKQHPHLKFDGATLSESPGTALPASGSVIFTALPAVTMANTHLCLSLRVLQITTASLSGDFPAGMTYIFHIEASDSIDGGAFGAFAPIYSAQSQIDVAYNGLLFGSQFGNANDVTLLVPPPGAGNSLSRILRIRLQIIAGGTGGTVANTLLALTMTGRSQLS